MDIVGINLIDEFRRYYKLDIEKVSDKEIEKLFINNMSCDLELQFEEMFNQLKK